MGRHVRAWQPPVAVALFWLASLWFSVATIELLNDHFGRISPARQIARYGELPFRDYFDPGYFLTELSSAAVQRLFGDNLLGEILLTSVFVATGAVFVLLLVRRLCGSWTIGLAAGTLAVVAMPRAYDYDKVLFFPLVAWLWSRYVDRRRTSDLVVVAAAIVVAAMYRYDSLAYLGTGAVAAMLVLHRTDRRSLRAALAWLGGTVLVLSLPVLLFLQINDGLHDVVDQVVTYGVRESEPLRLLVLAHLPPPNTRVQVRWTREVDVAERRALATRHGLADEARHGDAENRTWDYTVTDASVERLQALVNDPQVEDTNLIDRQRFALLPEPAAVRFARAVPLVRLRFRPDLFDSRSGLFFFLLFWSLPIVGAFVLFKRRRDIDTSLTAIVAGLVVLCLLLDAFIVRDPVAARVGGVTGPFAVLAAWLVRRAWQGRLLTRAVAALLVIASVYHLSVLGDWPRRVTTVALGPRHMTRLLTAAATPGDVSLAPGESGGVARYVRTCTRPDDRVFGGTFIPELFFFAQRPFAGLMVASFSAHWSDHRFEERSLAALRVQAPPIAVFENRGYDRFRADYPALAAFFQEHYRDAGAFSFDPEEPAPVYRVLTRTDRPPTGRYSPLDLPCFS